MVSEWPLVVSKRKFMARIRDTTRHWGLDKSYKIVRVRSYEFEWISHLVKYVRIGREIALEQLLEETVLYSLGIQHLDGQSFQLEPLIIGILHQLN